MKPRSFKLLAGLACVLISALFLISCSQSGSTSTEPIKFGVNGRKLELVYYDDQSKPDRATRGVAKLVDEDHVSLILGAYSSESTLAIVPVVTAKRVPLIIPTAVADNIMKANSPWVFRVCAGSGDYARSTLDFLKNNGNPKTMAIIYENTNFGQANRKSMSDSAHAAGLDVVAEEGYQAKSPSYEDLLRRVKERNPGAVYFASYLFDASALMRQAAQVQLNSNYYTSAATGFAAAEFPTDKGAGKFANYTFSVAQWLPTAKWPGSKEFDEKYLRLTGKHPAFHSVQAYAALLVAADALKRTKAASPEAIRDAIRDTDLPQTVFGPIKFDEHGQNAHPLLAQNLQAAEARQTQIQDQQYKVVWPSDVAETKPIVPTPAWSQR